MLGLLLPAGRVEAQAQAPAGPVKGFNIPWIDKETFELKARVRGAVAQPLGNDQVDVTEGFRVDFFSGGERTNFVILADHCRVFLKERRLESPGPLRVETSDGQLRLEGVGFSWDESQGLTISNQVSAKLNRLLASAEGQPEGDTSGAAAAVDESLNIRSDRFNYREGEARFSGGVRVTEPAGELRCERLGFRLEVQPGEVLPGAGERALSERVERILVEESVEVTSPGTMASADRGEYLLSGRTLELSGHARWKAEDREGEADRVWIDREAGRMRAVDRVRVRMPAESFTAGLLPTELSSGKTRDTPDAAEAKMEIRADELVVEPEADQSVVRRAVFSRRVQVLHGGAELRSASLTLRYESSTAEGREATERPLRPIEAVADGGVDILREGDWVAGSRATYTASSGVVRMAGPVDWRLGGREGHSDTLELNPARRETRAQGDVRMRMPAGGWRGAGQRLSGNVSGVEVKADSERGTDRSLTVTAGAQVEITCDEFRYVGLEAGGEAGGGTAEWVGGVRMVQGSRLRMRCERLATEVVGPDNRIRSMQASGGVEVVAEDARGTTRARGDRADYEAESDELRLTGERGVDLDFTDAVGVHRGQGEALVYKVSEDRLELRGDARLDSAHGSVTGEVVEVNRSNHLLSAQGMWRIRLPARLVDDRLRNIVPGAAKP